MIYVGKHVQLQALCGDCGKPISNCMDGMTSAFIVGHCQNPECESCAAQITIERSSMQIIAVDITPASDGGKRIYPVMADKEGKQVWPEPSAESKLKDKIQEAIGNVHAYVDRNIPADNTCMLCGYFKEDPIHGD